MGKKSDSGAARAARVPAVVTYEVVLDDGTFHITANYADGSADNYDLSPSDETFNTFAAFGLKQYLAGRVSAHTKDAAKAVEMTAATIGAIGDGNVSFGRKRSAKQHAPLVRALAEVKGISEDEAEARLADKTTGFKLSLRRDPAVAAALVKFENGKGSAGLLDQV